MCVFFLFQTTLSAKQGFDLEICHHNRVVIAPLFVHSFATTRKVCALPSSATIIIIIRRVKQAAIVKQLCVTIVSVWIVCRSEVHLQSSKKVKVCAAFMDNSVLFCHAGP